MTHYPRGSEWRIWDLHVHTPDSLVEDYKGPEDERWPRFIDELEALPADLRVIGINDYWFLDGYKKVRAQKEAGRLPNIDEIFPVIEVRCDTFSGSEGGLKRLNVHVILDPTEPVDDLDQQLRTLFKARYRLTPDDAPVEWSEVPTVGSMERLGQRILESTPAEKRAEFVNRSHLEIGFHNLNVSFDALAKGIEDNTYLRDHAILAVGKVEWDTIKWTTASVANKKSFVNRTKALFTAAKTRDAFHKSLASLRKANVNHHLLDCSDAHTWAGSDSHNRLGFCFTWVNADPTFKGLRQALQEYDQRVTVAERPDVLTRVAQSPRSVITDVTIRAAVTAEPDKILFGSNIPINSGFVVVIGNKGQGKSALLDSMALAANSDRHADFSFLNAKRFRAPGGVADQYEVVVGWADGSSSTARLDDRYSAGSPIRVDYLPQSLIEKVCSADPNSRTKQEFEAEIERVVFRHIDDEKRGSATSLRQLLQTQGTSHQAILTDARARIVSTSEALTSLRRRLSELHGLDLPGREASVTASIDEIEAELLAVTTEIDSGGTAEQQAQAAELRSAREKQQQVTEAIEDLRRRREAITRDVDEVGGLKERLLALLAEAQETSADLAVRVGISAESLWEVSFEEAAIDSWVAERVAERTSLEQLQTQSGGLDDQLAVASQAVVEQQAALQSLNDEAQSMLTRQSDFRAQISDLVGEPGEPETLRGVQALRAELDGIPEAIAAAESALDDAFREVHSALSGIKELQRAAYEPATQFVESNDLAANAELGFDVEFRVREFTDRWLAMVNRQRLGQFLDLSLPDRDEQILSEADLDDVDSLLGVLHGIVDRLSREGGRPDGEPRPLDAIMRSGHTPAGLLSVLYGLEWLQSQYIIRSAGAELSELSPGQRGLVLLLFYLLVDRSERPLLLDQPEENLDNQTVRTVLVPALQEAVRRRQVIAVTHNPNFAVVGDADQIIVATFDGRFTYEAGSIAEVPIGESAINVLEGTREAFVSRNVKYTDVVGPGS